jgi:hypothetical protein
MRFRNVVIKLLPCPSSPLAWLRRESKSERTLALPSMKAISAEYRVVDLDFVI